MKRRHRLSAASESKAPHYYAPGYGKRFEAARLALGLSLSEAGRCSRVSKGTIRHIEDEDREVQAKTREKLARFYGVDPEWLLRGTGTMRPHAGNGDVATVTLASEDDPSPARRRPRRA